LFEHPEHVGHIYIVDNIKSLSTAGTRTRHQAAGSCELEAGGWKLEAGSWRLEAGNLAIVSE
jgi:hypothetical protein